ncbi:rhamnogalacturonyl hydrolase YesR [Mariniflexile fucanivorans]|uniref:Rhamnogalacturonyl hydrolase YesR n=1 Tax=Mariniflexile fucanivorans TaxID=264023 RepID=A0A4R1RLI4_9FLAO|nr:glycoside hydrolase family 88 protein [Mariniflexile fucanivorans]TCL66909.1 rhamnogalacturonyl hydrolase YesR [Mariniflexile fucanivorans]
MKQITILILFVVLAVGCKTPQNKSEKDANLLKNISQQLAYFPVLKDTANIKSNASVFPRTLTPSGELELVSKRDWTSGFYPGVLWYMYSLTGEKQWKDKAEIYTDLLKSEQFNDSNHDLGFKMMPSFGLGYELTKNESYKKVLIQSARTLITRFNEKVGCIRSWDHNRDKWEFPVIIDNLMNLELLFWASKETGDPVFYNIAVTHAKTTMKNHFRSDYSSYHVVGYNAETGEVISKNTHQGYADESSWARGQAWALYGYTMIYRETKDPIFLKQAENVANYILNIAKFPEDHVPVWDFDLTDVKTEPRDASAAAVMASAFLELSTFTEQHKSTYVEEANKMITSLSTNKYFSELGANKGFLLMHSTGSKPKDSEIDVPLIYADYYYLEALSREINNQKQPN